MNGIQQFRNFDFDDEWEDAEDYEYADRQNRKFNKTRKDKINAPKQGTEEDFYIEDEQNINEQKTRNN